MKTASPPVRLMRVGFILAVVQMMTDAGSLTLWSASSDSRRLAVLLGDPAWIGWAFYACAVLPVPLAVANVLGWPRWGRAATFLACTGAMAACLLYVACAYAGANAELLQIRIVYCSSAALCAWLAVSVAATVNYNQRRDLGMMSRADFHDSNKVELGKP